jgi:hypothetical protein
VRVKLQIQHVRNFPNAHVARVFWRECVSVVPSVVPHEWGSIHSSRPAPPNRHSKKSLTLRTRAQTQTQTRTTTERRQHLIRTEPERVSPLQRRRKHVMWRYIPLTTRSCCPLPVLPLHSSNNTTLNRRLTKRNTRPRKSTPPQRARLA